VITIVTRDLLEMLDDERQILLIEENPIGRIDEIADDAVDIGVTPFGLDRQSQQASW